MWDDIVDFHIFPKALPGLLLLILDIKYLLLSTYVRVIFDCWASSVFSLLYLEAEIHALRTYGSEGWAPTKDKETTVNMM